MTFRDVLQGDPLQNELLEILEVCWAGKCQAPTCTDSVQNSKETGIDCGGGPPCPEC